MKKFFEYKRLHLNFLYIDKLRRNRLNIGRLRRNRNRKISV
jgi:glucan phosphorylase